MSTETATKTTRCESQLLSEGDFLSRTSYMQVTGKNGRFIGVKNEHGEEWQIVDTIVAAECFSANQAEEEIALNRTDLIRIFNEVGDKVFTVNFDKLPTADDFLELTRGEAGKLRTFEDMKKDFKKLKGENRTMIGYLLKAENGFGRSMVKDLEKGAPRQVDHRTLNWLIVGNKKYICTSK